MRRIRFAALFAVLLMALSLPPSNYTVEVGSGEATRAEDLIISSGKTVINSPAEYRNIIVNGTGRLEIQAPAVVSVEEKFIVNSPESTLEIIGGTLTVSGGFFYVKAKYVKIRDSPLIYVRNTTYPGPGEEGASSRLYINTTGESSGRGVFIQNSILKVEGEAGGIGSQSGSLGGKGGSASLYISTIRGHHLEIWESTIGVFGGDGGDAGPVVSAQGGRGGDAQLEIYSGGDLIVESSKINATAGDGGEPSSVARGGAGGIVNIYTLSARGYLNVTASEIVSLGGLRREVPPYTRESSRVYLVAGESIDFDSEKPVDKKDQSLSRIHTQDITFRAPGGVELHEVDTGESSPLTDVTDCTIYIYWYLTVKVTDNFGTPLSSTRIRIFRGTAELFPGKEFLTNEEGVWMGELPSKIITIDPNSNVFLHYNIKAEVPGGAVGTYPDVSLRGNTSIVLQVRLIDLEVTSIMGKSPYENMVVGGDVLIEGTAGVPPGVTRRVLQVNIQIDDGALEPAEDLTGDWSRWQFMWDTLQYSDGEHTINVYASDGTYTVVWSLSVVIDQSSVNHPPMIEEVSIRDGERIVRYKEDPYFHFWVVVTDIDGSSTLTLGREITEVEISFIHVATGRSVFTAVIPVTTAEVGRANISVDWNTFDVNEQDEDIFPAGNYTLRIRARDDANAWSRPFEISVQLIKYMRPTPALTSVNNMAPKWDPVNEILYIQITAKNKKSYDVVFNASASYDEDGTYYMAGDRRYYYRDLIFIWDFGDGSPPERIVGSPEVQHTYHFNSDIVFTVNLTVIDSDGLERSLHFQVRVDYVPPPEPPSGPLAEAFGKSIPLGEKADLTTGILLVVFLALVAFWYVYTEKFIPKNMKRKAERDVQEVIKMHESLLQKQAKALEEEFLKGKSVKAKEEKPEEATPETKEEGAEKEEEKPEATPTEEEKPKEEPKKEAPAGVPPPPPPPPPKT